MSPSSTVGLDLADPGWVRIDEAVVRVSGPVDDIVREMETVLTDQAVRSLCHALGILSTGFLFVDPYSPWLTAFFENPDPGRMTRPQKTYRTDYLWENAPAGERWSELVHSLFVYVRTLQANATETAKKRTEEYFRYLPKHGDHDYCIGEDNKLVRSNCALHYVCLGEMLFTIMAWRCLAVGLQLRGGAAPLADLDIGLGQVFPVYATCRWNGVDLLNSAHFRESGGRSDLLEAAWHELWGNRDCLRHDWHLLGLHSTASGNTTMERDALLTFIIGIGGLGPAASKAAVTDDVLNSAIQRNIANFIRHLGIIEQPGTVAEALTLIERYARLPILPFYMWHALDGAAKCYLVNAVWTSQKYNVVVDDAWGRCRHLGLALSAVAPLLRIDWTIPRSSSLGSEMRCSDADPLVLVNVIRLMARPLVEEHVYNSVFETVQRHVVHQTALRTINKGM